MKAFHRYEENERGKYEKTELFIGTSARKNGHLKTAYVWVCACQPKIVYFPKRYKTLK